MENGLFRGYGVEIELKDAEDFLKIKETLTRIGIASKKEKKLYQSCHILHKRGRYAIIHFKELFGLDGKETTISEIDIQRRNAVALLLEDWSLLKLVDNISFDGLSTDILQQIKIISFKDKKSWELLPKYSIGTK